MHEKQPLKDKVIDKWLCGSAREFLRCERAAPLDHDGGLAAGTTD